MPKFNERKFKRLAKRKTFAKKAQRGKKCLRCNLGTVKELKLRGHPVKRCFGGCGYQVMLDSTTDYKI
jgi:hypothetical protein